METYIEYLPSELISIISKNLIYVQDIHNFCDAYQLFKVAILESVEFMYSQDIIYIDIFNYKSLTHVSNTLLFNIKSHNDINIICQIPFKTSVNLFIYSTNLFESINYLIRLLECRKELVKLTLRLIFLYKYVYHGYVIADNNVLVINYLQIIGYSKSFTPIRDTYKKLLYNSIKSKFGDMSISEYIHDYTGEISLISLPRRNLVGNTLSNLILEKFNIDLHYYTNSRIRRFLSHEVFKGSNFQKLDVIDEYFLSHCILFYCMVTDNLTTYEVFDVLKIKSLDDVITELIGSSSDKVSEHVDVEDPFGLAIYLLKKLYTIYLIKNIDLICKIDVDPLKNKFSDDNLLKLELELAKSKLRRMFVSLYPDTQT